MQNRPERNEKKNAKSKITKARRGKQIIMILFAIFICVMIIIVQKSVTDGIGLPVSAVGEIVVKPTEPTPEPTETTTEPTEPSTEPTEPTPETTEKEPLTAQELAQQYLQSMTLEEKVWQMLIVRPNAAQTNSAVGGVYYAAEDLTDAQALTQSLDALSENAKVTPMLGVCEEGGSVAPLSALGVTNQFSSMSTYGAAGDVEAVYTFGATMGQQLAAAGFDFNLAPVADTINWYPDDIGERSFSTDVELTSQMVAQAVKGMQDNGTIACLKHFPNLGSSAPDGDNDVSWRPYSSFVQSDFKPFSAGIEAGVEMILVSNMRVPDMTTPDAPNNSYNLPCCMSKNVVTNILRGELGFEGVILSDNQQKQTDPQTAVQIVQAGCDIVFLPADAQASFDAIMAAIADGTLTEERINESVSRILLLKCNYGILVE